jgi:tetratricopeptide (TPR) repeat protein
MAQQKFPKAYEAYQQAVYRDGRNPTFWCSIGVLYYQINQYRDALDAYSRAIRLNPYISEVWYDLGTLVCLLFSGVVFEVLTQTSTSPATIKRPMLLMPMPAPQNWILPTRTSKLACSSSEMEVEAQLSTMLQRHKTFIHRHIKVV